MKKLASKFFAFGVIALSLSACDAKNDVIDNMVYISESASDPSSEIVLGKTGETAQTTINVRMAQKAAVDTKIQLALDESVLSDYNKLNQTEYVIVPSEYISFPSEVTIPAGSAMVGVPVTITSFDGEKGVDYAAPLRIIGADMEISSGSSSHIITFGKPLIQSAPGFLSNNAMSMDWDEEVSLPNLTLEWWARVTNTSGTGGFSINNQAIFSFVSNYELYVRFGDIVYADSNGRNLYNFLQIKTMGIDANYDSGDPNKTPLNWGEWIHFAHTYDAGTGDVILYMNGVEVNRNNGGAGNVFNITGLSMCSAGSYHRDVIELAQVRLWKTTRTAAQIAKYMKKEVKYNDPNLVFYLPMNEGSGSVLHDVTGNGHDVTIGSNGGSNNQAHSWTEYTF